MITLDNIVLDKIEYGVAQKTDGSAVHYILTQLADASIETTSESKESRDKNNTLIRKIYTGKSGTFSANNAMLNVSLIASASGKDKEIASSGNAISVPYAETVKKSASNTSTTITGLDTDNVTSVSVVGLNAAGSMVESYTKDTTAGDKKFAVSTAGVVTLPTGAATEVTSFLVMCKRKSETSVRVANEADKFPKTVRLTLFCTGYEACSPDVERRIILVIPSFQPSPDMSISLNTDSQMEYKGDMQTAYCGADGKILYEIFIDPLDED